MDKEMVYFKLISIFAKDISFILKMLTITICLGVLCGIICGVLSKDYHIFDTIIKFADSSIKHIIS